MIEQEGEVVVETTLSCQDRDAGDFHMKLQLALNAGNPIGTNVTQPKQHSQYPGNFVCTSIRHTRKSLSYNFCTSAFDHPTLAISVSKHHHGRYTAAKWLCNEAQETGQSTCHFKQLGLRYLPVDFLDIGRLVLSRSASSRSMESTASRSSDLRCRPSCKSGRQHPPKVSLYARILTSCSSSTPSSSYGPFETHATDEQPSLSQRNL